MGLGLHRQLLSRPCSDKAKSIVASPLKGPYGNMTLELVPLRCWGDAVFMSL